MATEFGLAEIEAASRRIAGRVIRTPVLSSPMLDELAKCRVFVKAESLQRTGSFKFRGALNKILAMDPEVRRRGIITYSAGNHGHAVAAAAREVGCPAVIVLPVTAPTIKVDNCRWWGAETVFYDPTSQDREEVARAIAEPRGLELVPPFDDFEVMAGQGTAGLEFAEELVRLDACPDALLVCCSGGGLASGAATAMKARFPDLACHVVEPAGLDKMARSLACGFPQPKPSSPTTIMDGIAGPIAGARPLAVLRGLGATGLTVTDAEAQEAMAVAFRFLKLVLEPGGAAALAAAITKGSSLAGKTVAVIGTGGNVDEDVFADAVAGDARSSARSSGDGS
ncbi:threonine ammonia-lyase [Methylobacterium pseudosasicola]|uniref:Threonine dehydratase n=1 Tax=Methylobacterium pseudosasicola TaxID=582667 RepID=A0A1I4NK57_9HYPH|nr:threonine/serine dehydratase [Methylobacterium pseudosasicola]SFM15904.1 threonine dehydratase [Methylobacterium pseudosasicola]